MARLGITTATLSETVRVATIGDVDTALSKVYLDDRMIPIRVQLDLSLRRNMAELRAIKVPTASGASVPLSSVPRSSIPRGRASSSAMIAAAS